jgi:preprotein translocase subunit YajC
LPLWLGVGLLLAPVCGWWQQLPSLFDIIALCIAYSLIAATFYFMLARPAQRNAGLLVEAMRRTLQKKPEVGS